MKHSAPPLPPPAPPDAATLARVRAALAPALAPAGLARPSWRRDALALWAVTAGLALLGALVTRLAGAWAVASPRERAGSLALLLAAQGVGSYAAAAPRARRSQVAAVALAVATMVALVALRRAGAPSLSSPLVCTVSHIALGVLPLAVALRALRRAAVTPLRALSAGLAVGTVGALLGELACGRDAAHLAAFHLPAWLLVSAATALLARRARPESFAP